MEQRKIGVKTGVGKSEGMVKALCIAISEKKGALSKGEGEREQGSTPMEIRMEYEVTEKKRIEEELSGIKEDLKTMRTGSGGTVSSAASTGYGLDAETFTKPPSLAARGQSEVP